jgi:hypothetical protein
MPRLDFIRYHWLKKSSTCALWLPQKVVSAAFAFRFAFERKWALEVPHKWGWIF